MFRVASVSKIVVGQCFAKVAGVVGLHPPYETAAQDVLGFALRHPNGQAVTLGQLASHSSGLHDAAGYIVPAGQRLSDWMAAKGHAVFGPHAPGAFCAYANLNYLLLAACCEMLAADRFDRLARIHVLDPWGVPGGFNWAGTSPQDRRAALPTYRHDTTGFHPQIDADLAPCGVLDPNGRAQDMQGYQPGDNPSLMSPPGGLRTSLRGLLTIASALRHADQTQLWDHTKGAGDALGGLMQSYGLGVQILPDPSFYPRPLVGHFAKAYGFMGGVWYDANADLAFAYALNGAAVGDETDTLSQHEHDIFAAVAAYGE